MSDKERTIANLRATEAVLRGEIRQMVSALEMHESVLDERDALRAQVERVRALLLAADHATLTSLSRTINGTPFPALIPADHLRDALDGAQ